MNGLGISVFLAAFAFWIVFAIWTSYAISANDMKNRVAGLLGMAAMVVVMFFAIIAGRGVK